LQFSKQSLRIKGPNVFLKYQTGAAQITQRKLLPWQYWLLHQNRTEKLSRHKEAGKVIFPVTKKDLRVPTP